MSIHTDLSEEVAKISRCSATSDRTVSKTGMAGLMDPHRPILNTDGVSLTLADEVYQRVRMAILALELRPGQLIEEDRLASKFGVSRTPIREAIRRLEQDGLVTVRPRRGAYISEITLRDALEIDQLREVLEPFAAKLAAQRISAQELRDLARELEDIEVENPSQADFVRYLQFDIRFHDLILRVAGNEIMREVVTRLHHRMNSIRVVSTSPRYRQSISEHKQIIAALERGDGLAASAAMKEHVRNSREGRQRAFFQEG